MDKALGRQLAEAEDDQSFRSLLRDVFRDRVPPDIRAKVSAGQPLSKEDIVTSQRVLNAYGIAVPHWPGAWGGRGWSPSRYSIFLEELQFNAVPLPLQFNCFMIGPVLAAFGTEAQKHRFLARAANADDWWCQGFSEPGAGSDLAALSTRAIDDGDSFLVSGQKAWTTYGQYADWMFCLVRTAASGNRRDGISFVLIDMRSQGISVRPTITLDGRHEVNEVFLDGVRVPKSNLVGEENRGWDIARFLLANERSGIARIGLSKEKMARVRRRAVETGLWQDPVFQAAVLQVEVDIKALEVTQLRILNKAGAQDNQPDPASSILKLRGSQLQQRAAELLMEVEGQSAIRVFDNIADPAVAATDETAPAAAMNAYLNFRKVTIYGGSSEIQKGIIARTILNL